MQRRTFLTKTLNRLALGAAGSVLFNLFESGRAVASFYSKALSETPGVPENDSFDADSESDSDGPYRLTYEWSDRTPQCWRMRLRIEPTEYDAATERSRGYLSAFEAAKSNPLARRVARRLETAESNCRQERTTLSAAEHLERAVGFVRSLEYARDFESKGVPEYHRTVEETLVEGRGDCKDLTYLLAGVLSQAPFEYRTAMVFLPEHMLLGVHESDLPAAYADASTLPNCAYVPIESTSDDPVGEIRDDPVLAVYGSGFEHVDGSAVTEVTGRFLRDPSEFDVVEEVV